MGINNFSTSEIVHLKEFEGTHYGKPSDAESLVSIDRTANEKLVWLILKI